MSVGSRFPASIPAVTSSSKASSDHYAASIGERGGAARARSMWRMRASRDRAPATGYRPLFLRACPAARALTKFALLAISRRSAASAYR